MKAKTIFFLFIGFVFIALYLGHTKPTPENRISNNNISQKNTLPVSSPILSPSISPQKSTNTTGAIELNQSDLNAQYIVVPSVTGIYYNTNIMSSATAQNITIAYLNNLQTAFVALENHNVSIFEKQVIDNINNAYTQQFKDVVKNGINSINVIKPLIISSVSLSQLSVVNENALIVFGYNPPGNLNILTQIDQPIIFHIVGNNGMNMNFSAYPVSSNNQLFLVGTDGNFTSATNTWVTTYTTVCGDSPNSHLDYLGCGIQN